jgi:dienelactone hydrolase
MFRSFFTAVILTFVNLVIVSPPTAPGRETSDAFPLGVIIPKVAASADTRQTYALYLPLTYSREQRWPVVYVFDPGARGTLALAQFQHAAELHRFIVAASNNSHNGPWTPEFEAGDTMVRDTQQRFSVDTRRIYFAGFSGGARVASRLAQLCKCAAGVLLSGAGFSRDFPPSPDSRFAVFSAVGNTDFNYSELIPLQDALEKAAFPHWLTVFDGGHEWAPPKVMDRALAWFRIQSANSPRESLPVASDEGFLAAEFAAAQTRAQTQEQGGDLLTAWREYRQIAATFEPVFDVSAVRAKAAQLGNQKAVLHATKREKNDFEEQDRLSGEILLASASNRDNPLQTESEQSAVALAKSLRLRVAGEKRPEHVVVFKRALSGVFVGSMEAALDALDKKDYLRAARQFACASEANPESEWALRNLAIARVLSADRKGAYQALRSARKITKDASRFSDWMKQEPVFESLRSASEFVALSASP